MKANKIVFLYYPCMVIVCESIETPNSTDPETNDLREYARIVRFSYETKFFPNSGKLLFVPYTKDFGRITQFWGNDLATVLYATFCSDMLSSHSFSKQR